MKTILPLSFLTLFLFSCRATRHYDPTKKFAPAVLQKDYQIFRNILEESHPSLYWYTPKDSIDYYFAQGAAKLNDSLPEYKFRLVLSYVISKLRCGHTTVRASKAASKYNQKTRGYSFPLNIKTWNDTAVITSSLNRRDTSIYRGSILRSIDGKPIKEIIDTFFQHLSADGYNTTHKFQTLSNAGVFRSYYAAVYGLKPKMPVTLIDSLGQERTAILTPFLPAIDSTKGRAQPPRPSRHERKKRELEAVRDFQIDTSLRAGVLVLNSFSTHNRIRSFFRKSFRTMRKKHIQNLIVDMRGNGGGNVTLSNLLTRYLADKPFKIADSLYAIKNRSSYGKYQSGYFLNRLFFLFLTRKQNDGKYHFPYFEGREFKPRKSNHFEGTTYILTGGNTFSAAVLFTGALRNQNDVVVVGEETGGGSYGNTAWLIPDITLPNTHVRFRLPLFRLVIDANAPKGRGVFPEVEVPPTIEAIIKNEDYKMEAVKQLIREHSLAPTHQ